MKKGDIVVLGVIAAVFILSIVMLTSFSKNGSRVIVKQDNKVVYDQSITKNNTVDTGSNVVVIENKAVYMKQSNCKNQICVKSDKISKKGESIICLPNKVIVEIK
ncbi:MAG: NusG domain II-containing protein [Clostridia bacterium]|nr:NusG domain II-containing protein [Clostridia bacterium]